MSKDYQNYKNLEWLDLQFPKLNSLKVKCSKAFRLWDDYDINIKPDRKDVNVDLQMIENSKDEVIKDILEHAGSGNVDEFTLDFVNDLTVDIIDEKVLFVRELGF